MKKISTALALLSSMVGGSAFAAAPDYTILTSGIDFSTTITAVMAIALSLVGLYLAIKGSKIVIGMVRGR